MSESRRCHHLADLAQALGFACDRVRGGQRPEAIALRARVQTIKGCVLSEEVHPRRLSVRWVDPAARASVLVLHQGQGIVELPETCQGQRLFPVAAGQTLVLASPGEDLTLPTVPCRLLRVLLPPGTVVPFNRVWTPDLSLLLPMLRLLEQADQKPDASRTRLELAHTLLTYLWDRLEAVGCRVVIADGSSAEVDPLERLDQWMALHLGEPIHLADLAEAVNLSPRRLQELCRRQHGCSPMERLRQHRLEALAQHLQGPTGVEWSLKDLMAALHLPDSVTTRQSFVDRYGCRPSEMRRQWSAARTQAC